MTHIHLVACSCPANNPNGEEHFRHRWIDSAHTTLESAEARAKGLTHRASLTATHPKTLITIKTLAVNESADADAYNFDHHGVPSSWPDPTDNPDAPYNPDLQYPRATHWTVAWCNQDGGWTPASYHETEEAANEQRDRDTAAGYSVLVVPPACNPAAGITSDQ